MPLLLLLLLLFPLSVSAEYLGDLSANPIDSDSTTNPFGAGSPLAPGLSGQFGPVNEITKETRSTRAIPTAPAVPPFSTATVCGSKGSERETSL